MTSYNTLSRDVDTVAFEERKPEVSLKLAATVALCACVLFFAGRTATPKEFSHQEVQNIAAFCSGGHFIGGCSSCKECATYEFANGGCSYFKDTFCSFCEPITNCPREQISCTSVENSYCQLCNCDDPVAEWDDNEVLFAADRGLDGNTYSCYIANGSEEEGGECEPCHVCAKGEFEVEACNPTMNTQTVCQACTQCEAGEWVQRACTYATDTVCQACDWCSNGDGEDHGLYTFAYCDAGTIFAAGSNAVCRECTTCEDGEWVSNMCTAAAQLTGEEGQGNDTECTACSLCAGPSVQEEWDESQWVEHIDGEDGRCVKGGRYANELAPVIVQDGHDTVCVDCTMPSDVNGCGPDNLGCSMWTSRPCNPRDTIDAVYQACDTCADHEFYSTECEFRPGLADKNAQCTPCAEASRPHPQASPQFPFERLSGRIPQCPIENHRCGPLGEPYIAVIGVDDKTIFNANSFEGDTNAYEIPSDVSHRTVLSHCAVDDDDQVCGIEKNAPSREGCNVEACEPGFFGPNCQYEKSTAGCGIGHFLERTAKRGRKWFDGSNGDGVGVDLAYAGRHKEHSGEDFLAYCMMMCEESPICRAFEIVDNGQTFGASGDWYITPPDVTTCRLFAELTEGPPNPALDCYVNKERYCGGDGGPENEDNQESPSFPPARCSMNADAQGDGEGANPLPDLCRDLVDVDEVATACLASTCRYIASQLESGRPMCDDANIVDILRDQKDRSCINRGKLKKCKYNEVTRELGFDYEAFDDCYCATPHCALSREEAKNGCIPKCGTPGESWCDLTKQCQDNSAIPCMPKINKYDCDAQFPGEGKVYCFCTGSCLDPLTEECHEYISPGGDIGQLGGNVVMAMDLAAQHGRVSSDCWAVDNEHFHALTNGEFNGAQKWIKRNSDGEEVRVDERDGATLTLEEFQDRYGFDGGALEDVPIEWEEASTPQMVERAQERLADEFVALRR